VTGGDGSVPLLRPASHSTSTLAFNTCSTATRGTRLRVGRKNTLRCDVGMRLEKIWERGAAVSGAGGVVKVDGALAMATRWRTS